MFSSDHPRSRPKRHVSRVRWGDPQRTLVQAGRRPDGLGRRGGLEPLLGGSVGGERVAGEVMIGTLDPAGFVLFQTIPMATAPAESASPAGPYRGPGCESDVWSRPVSAVVRRSRDHGDRRSASSPARAPAREACRGRRAGARDRSFARPLMRATASAREPARRRPARRHRRHRSCGSPTASTPPHGRAS